MRQEVPMTPDGGPLFEPSTKFNHESSPLQAVDASSVAQAIVQQHSPESSLATDVGVKDARALLQDLLALDARDALADTQSSNELDSAQKHLPSSPQIGSTKPAQPSESSSESALQPENTTAEPPENAKNRPQQTRDPVKTQVLYLVKWRGYSHADNTWEPVDNLHEVMWLVREFERRNAHLLPRLR